MCVCLICSNMMLLVQKKTRPGGDLLALDDVLSTDDGIITDSAATKAHSVETLGKAAQLVCSMANACSNPQVDDDYVAILKDTHKPGSEMCNLGSMRSHVTA